MADKPRFIRKNGRIIPIGPKKGPSAVKRPNLGPRKRTDIKKGLAFVAAGIGVAALSGLAAGKLFKAAAKVGAESAAMTKTASFSFGYGSGIGHGTSFGKKVGEILHSGAIKRARKTVKTLKFSQNILHGGRALGAALIAKGAAESSENKEVKKFAPYLGAVGGLAGSFAFKKGASAALISRLKLGKL